MNFGFDLNTIIPYEITKYNSDLRIIHPPELSQDEYASQLNRDLIQKLCYIIDRMGEASAKVNFRYFFKVFLLTTRIIRAWFVCVVLKGPVSQRNNHNEPKAIYERSTQNISNERFKRPQVNIYLSECLSFFHVFHIWINEI